MQENILLESGKRFRPSGQDSSHLTGNTYFKGIVTRDEYFFKVYNKK
jgi:hypothetical protein